MPEPAPERSAYRTLARFGQWLMDLTKPSHRATWWRNKRYLLGARTRDRAVDRIYPPNGAPDA